MKETNLIFVEHDKLLREDSLLMRQVKNYEEKTRLLELEDSLKTVQYNNQVQQMQDKFDKDLKKKNKKIKLIKIGYSTVVAGLLAWLIAI